jgi:hypothetical protein
MGRRLLARVRRVDGEGVVVRKDTVVGIGGRVGSEVVFVLGVKGKFLRV